MSIGRDYKTRTQRQYRFPVWLQTKSSDDWEGDVTWTEEPDGYFFADIQPNRYKIIAEGVEETLVDKFQIHLPWRPGISIYGDFVQRLRTEFEGLYYYIESVVDLGATAREFEVTCTQRLEVDVTPSVSPILPGGELWVTLNGNRQVRL